MGNVSKAERKVDVVIIASFGDSLVRFRGDLLRQLRNRGQRVLALAPDLSRSARAWLAQNEIAYEEAPLARTGTSVLADLRFLRWVVSRVRRADPAVVLAYTAKPVVYGMLAAATTRARRYALITGLGYAFTEGQGNRQNVRRVLEWLYRAALLKVDAVFFQNPDDEIFFRARRLMMPSVRSVVLAGSGVDVTRFSEVPFESGPTTFLLIARLIGDKGIREYVEAARVIKSRHPHAVFRLVGWIDSNPDAIRHEELATWIDEGVIEYLGRIDDVRPAIAGCTVYVLPSYREGTPRTVLEAMAMGRPVITTDAPGCRETVRDGVTGFLVAPKSVSGLVRVMERFVAEPELAREMGAHSRALAVRKYDARDVTRTMLDQMGIGGAGIGGAA